MLLAVPSVAKRSIDASLQSLELARIQGLPGSLAAELALGRASGIAAAKDLSAVGRRQFVDEVQ